MNTTGRATAALIVVGVLALTGCASDPRASALADSLKGTVLEPYSDKLVATLVSLCDGEDVTIGEISDLVDLDVTDPSSREYTARQEALLAALEKMHEVCPTE